VTGGRALAATAVHLRCIACGATHAGDARLWRCGCGGALDVVVPGARLDPGRLGPGPADVWRYAEALPPLRTRVSLGERATPLVPCRLGNGAGPVWLKCDYLMPTGSYKDRGAAVLMSHLRDLGVRRATDDSSGNAAAALAAYAAAAGIAMTVFCPASASPGKLAQIRLYGAELRRIDGPRRRTTEALLAHLDVTPDLFYASHLWHPYFLEGMKTLAFEIAEQRGWRAPGAVLCPVGAGSILLGLHKGFGELRATGVLDRLPRLFAIQAAAVDPVARAWAAGLDDVPPVDSAGPTLAEGIALPAPVRGRQVLAALRESGGGAVAVGEDEIRDGLLALGRRGICVEPTSAVVVGGLRRLRAEGALAAGEEPVLVLSGFGLKAGPALERLTGI
jgi:threonine synthase